VTTELRPAPALPTCCEVIEQHIHVEEGGALAEAATLFKALSDETRLRLLKAIAKAGELCECYAVPALGLSQPTINYHLKLLRGAGLIESERRGQWVYHRVKTKAVFGAVRELTEIS